MSPADEWLNLDRETAMKRWYAECYEATSYSGTAGRVQTWMHRSLERKYTAQTRFQSVLEVGGNRGEHAPYVLHAFDKYVVTDLSDELSPADKECLAERGMRFEIADVLDLPFPDGSFDRVLNTCVLHHVADPEKAFEEMRRVLVSGGTADIFLPSDPGQLFRLSKQLGTVRSARRMGLEDVKSLVDARDHRNHVGGLLRLMSHVFRHDELVRRTYPMPGMTWNSSLWTICRIRKQRTRSKD
jgi:phosphatidylethanolamine/phosphatidyl-N-methylethanolamine N-methyltransferase